LVGVNVGISSFTSTQRAPEKPTQGKAVRYGRLGSFKVIEIGTNRKPARDFLEYKIDYCCSLT